MKKILITIILLSLTGCGSNVIDNDLGASSVEIPLVFNLVDRDITINYTDDNTGEYFIIATDVNLYNKSLSEADVYFTIVNENSPVIADVSFLFQDGETINYIQKYAKVEKTRYIPEYSKESAECDEGVPEVIGTSSCYIYTQTGTTTETYYEDSWEDLESNENIFFLGAEKFKTTKPKKKSEKVKKSISFRTELSKYKDEKYGGLGAIATSSLDLYRANINYPYNNKNEFFIEVIGADGSYAHLDPNFGSGWTRKATINIDSSKVSTTLTDYPLLLTEDNIPSEMLDADGSNPAKSDGCDIRFSSDEAGDTELPIEIVTFTQDNDPANGVAEIYTKVASVSSSATTTIYVWYGNSGASCYAVGDTYGRNAVWSDYTHVFHLGDAGASATDSSGNNNGTFGGDLPDSNACKIGNCQNFDGTGDRIDIAKDSFSKTQDYTLSAWFKTSTTGVNQIVFGRFYTPKLSQLNITAANVLSYRAGANPYNNTGDITTVTDGAWHGITLSHDASDTGNEYKLIIDAGAPQTEPEPAGDYGEASNTPSIGIRDGDDVGPFTGDIDEFRIRLDALTEGWADSEYNNQNDSATFSYAGTPEDVSTATIIDMLFFN